MSLKLKALNQDQKEKHDNFVHGFARSHTLLMMKKHLNFTTYPLLGHKKDSLIWEFICFYINILICFNTSSLDFYFINFKHSIVAFQANSVDQGCRDDISNGAFDLHA